MSSVSLLRHAAAQYDSGDFDAARVSTTALLRNADAEGDDLFFAEGLLLLSSIHCASGDFNEAESLAATCGCFVEERFGPSHVGVITARVNRAVALLEGYRLRGGSLCAVRRAHTLLQQAERLAEDAGGTARLALAEVWHNTGVCCELVGRYTDALDAYMRSMQIRVRYTDAGGVTDLKLALTMEHVAMLFRLMDGARLHEASRLMEAVAAARRRRLGPRHPLFAAAVLEQGAMAVALGHQRRAEGLLRRAVELYNMLAGPEDHHTQTAAKLLEEVAVELGPWLSHCVAMRVGQRVRLDISAWDAPSTDHSTLYLTVSGVVVGERHHQDDPSRVLYYFHTVRVERSIDAVAAATMGKSNPVHPRRERREELYVGLHAITSAGGFKYSYDGWYDEIFLYRLDDDADTVPHEWRVEMDRDTSPCELLYLSYASRPWFHCPFDALQYVRMADRHLCYSVSLCHRCLSPFFSRRPLAEHLAGYCRRRRPPGTLIYHDPHTDRKVYAVDGAAQLHYARCLSLLGKCFLESKIVVNDVDVYEFFVVTAPRRSLPYVVGEMDEMTFRREATHFDAEHWDGDVVVGYFTRLKRSPNHCLSCILSLPMFQQQGLGFFMLDVAYALTGMRQKLCGCDLACGQRGGDITRPFSPHGQALLVAYWRRRVTAALLANKQSNNNNNNNSISGPKGSADACRGANAKDHPPHTPDETPQTFADLHAKVLAGGFPIHEEDLRFFAFEDERSFYARVEQEETPAEPPTRGGRRTGASMDGEISLALTPKMSELVGSLILFKSDAVAVRREGAFEERFLLRDKQGRSVYTPQMFHYGT